MKEKGFVLKRTFEVTKKNLRKNLKIKANANRGLAQKILDTRIWPVITGHQLLSAAL